MSKLTAYIHLMRHGEPVGGRKYRGQQDDPLSRRGWEQMWAALDGHEKNWDLIITSPLQRCNEFAQTLGEKLHIDVIQNKNLAEIGMGEWEGKTADELKHSDPAAYNRFFTDPVNNRPAGGEVLISFYQRVTQTWDSLLTQYPHTNMLIIAHAGVLRAITCHLLQTPLYAMYRMRFNNAALIQVNMPCGLPAMINL